MAIPACPPAEYGSSLLDQANDAHQAVADYADRAHQAFDDQSEQVRQAIVQHGGQVEEIAPLVDLTFGVTPNPGYRLQTLDLRQGDRLVMLTDGMLEPHGAEANLTGLIRQTGEWHPRDAVRAFTEAVLGVSNHDPRDDATVLCLDFPAANSPYTGPQE